MNVSRRSLFKGAAGFMVLAVTPGGLMHKPVSDKAVSMALGRMNADMLVLVKAIDEVLAPMNNCIVALSDLVRFMEGQTL